MLSKAGNLRKQEAMLLSSSANGKNVYRIGGASFGLAGVFWLLNLIVLFTQGQPPVEGQAFLDYVVKQRLALQSAFLIFFVIDVLLVLGVTALYVALKHSGTYFLFGSVLGVVAITIDLGNTVVTYAVLGLSSSYSVATNEAQRFAYGAAAEFARVIILDVGAPFFNILFSISILAMSLTVLRTFGKSTGYLGILAGILGIVSGLLFLIPLLIPWAIWFLAVGYKLYKLPQN